MKKALKFIGKIILCVVALVVVAVLALPLWIGPVAKGVANAVVPGITGTAFNLGEFGLNPYSGTLHVGDMQLANPTNFSEKNAVDLKALDVNVAMTSLFGGKKYIVESIDLDGLVVFSDLSASNFRQIAANAAGEPKEEPTGEVARTAETNAPSEAPKADETPAQEQKDGKGVQIDRITLRNITIKYGPLPVKLPVPIEITGIGKDSADGASFAEIGQMIFEKVMGAAGGLGGKLGDLGKGALDIGMGAVGTATDALKGAGDAATGALKGAGDAAAGALKGAGDAATGALKGAGDVATGALKGAGDAATGVGGMATDALKGAGSTASDAVKGAGNALKGAGGAAADSLKSAGEGLKNLFK